MTTAARLLALIIVALAAAACGGATSVDVSASPAPATTAPAPSATAAAATLTWAVSDKSKATVRVREQLVGKDLPSDAILVATGAKGSFSVNADGSFAAGSSVTFDLRTLSSDERDRDNFVKQDTLRVSQFPTATFVPTKASGLTLPLPATGDFSFTLTGTLTIHGKDKVVTFDVKGTRSGRCSRCSAEARSSRPAPRRRSPHRRPAPQPPPARRPRPSSPRASSGPR